ncbi:MAG: carboxypeptidase-like regulatory domain-containing protein, partial [Bacteroidales bacterium]|nr:carboxypeptidase-like regulatory domain-containing protein [Bacteroidales bacterium]
MKRVYLLSTLITLISIVNGNSQTTQDSTIIESTKNNYSNTELKGLVLDIDKQTVLPYANIYVLHKNKGVISNEKGHFSINISDLDKTDTLRFQYIGYKTRNITIGQLETSSVVYLKEEIINLSEILIFGSPPDPVTIVKKVLENKDSNYKRTTGKNQTFIRERYISDIDEISLNYKKSSITELNREMIELVEKKIPKYSTSYTDFLGYFYFTKDQDDSITLKIDPIRTVSLKDKDIAELEQLVSVFENIIADTEEKEYWKIKSGVFSTKLDMDDENDELEKDSLNENTKKLSFFSRRVEYQLDYSLLDNKNQWEFLHNTGKYKYTLAGGTRVNG